MTTCERYAELEAAERYVAGRMTAGEAADFEQHFLACDACLETVRGMEDVRDVLVERRAAIARGEDDPLAVEAARVGAARPWSRKPRAWTGATWLAAAAALIAGVFWMAGGGLSRLGSPQSTGSPESPGSQAPAVARDAASPSASTPSQSPSTPSGSASAPGQPGQPGSNRAAPNQPNQAPANASSQPPPSSAPAQSPDAPPGSGSGPTALIARLAIVIPPPYVAVPVRGEGEDAQKSFAAAMTRYRAGDFAAAATGLRALVAKSPDLASAQFYLGVCELMTRQPRRAETALQAAADSDITPYADEAYFYLAKAALQRGDVTAAERALTEAVARDAGPGNEARRLLEEVRALGRS
jgi:TolA-binding protein